MKKNTQYIQVFTTVSKQKDAENLADILAKNNLSACTQIIGPITSIYKWKRKLEKSKEFLCIIKTKNNLYKKVELLIKKHHSYELPEIIILPIIDGSFKYFSWMEENLQSK